MLDPEQGTTHPFQSEERSLIACDFGAAAALALHDEEGPMVKPSLPRVKGGKSTSDEFTLLLPELLKHDDVVVESSTVGSSGVEPDVIARIVGDSPNSLYLLSTRAVKNYRRDHELAPVKSYGKYETPINSANVEDAHQSDARIIHEISTRQPERLKRWTLIPKDEKLQRTHHSVRPYDKRLYRGPEVDEYFEHAPDFSSLSADLQRLLGKGTVVPAKGTTHPSEYSRAKTLPLLMALSEPGSDTRSGYERILGLYDHGYPSFYRRKTVDLMQETAKRLQGTTKMEDVTRETRKQAWKTVRRLIREFYHLSKGTTHPEQGHS